MPPPAASKRRVAALSSSWVLGGRGYGHRLGRRFDKRRDNRRSYRRVTDAHETRTPTSAATALVENRLRAYLLLYLRDGVKPVELLEDKPLVLGREWPADVFLEDPSVSRRHASVVWRGGKLHVEDLGSRNGTWVNDLRVTEADLAPGDRLVLGGVIASLDVAGAKRAKPRTNEGFDAFVERLGDEVRRARATSRPLSLLLLDAEGSPNGHVSGWYAAVQADLGPMDHMSVYGRASALVLLPERTRESATALAAHLARHSATGRQLRTAVATFPSDATTADTLLSEVVGKARAPGAAPAEMRDGAGATPGTPVIGSPATEELWQLVDRVAGSSIPVLVLGETGTGKEVVATQIHARGPRRDRPMRSVNCAAIASTLVESTLFGHEKGAFTGADRAAKGIFEEADGGTVFLDEVGELSAAAQAALLRVLEAKRITRVGSHKELPVDVRVIAATHRDLETPETSGAFRTDLLYRLNAMVLRLPPLRDRAEEILPLAQRFLAESAVRSDPTARGFSEDAQRLLQAHTWPGNIRELRNVVDRALLICDGDTITPRDLPERIRRSAPTNVAVSALQADDSTDFRDRVREFETDLIRDALLRSNGNQTEAARLLRMPLRTFVHKLKALGIKKPE